MTPCNPRQPTPLCATCARYHPELPHLAECRPLTIVIDATVVMRGAVCPMHEPKAIERHWWHERESALEAA